MADLNERIEEPDETQEFSLSDTELEDVDLDETSDIDDDAEVTDEEKVDPVFDDDEEVLKDNFGYEE
ncbi:MAG: hypothetical protein EPO52_07555 [Herbiconiux sp.]|uniref:hypothetical protein n=1 Tax=Herbiconiux sp. TaxID=1871186 RepID=UPI001205F6F6|nr:hypothetical protein [Herbiconiux sp.]TAJ48026.1 MAG: hypothetical protein EPO52_07555 [Herbiconiux sp.]